MAVSSRPLEHLFASAGPDPERPASLGPGEAEMSLAEFTEGPLESGVWTCGVGSWDETDTPADEIMVLLEGKVRLVGADGVVTEAGAGELLHVPAGWSGQWNVIEPIRKVWVMPGTQD